MLIAVATCKIYKENDLLISLIVFLTNIANE